MSFEERLTTVAEDGAASNSYTEQSPTNIEAKHIHNTVIYTETKPKSKPTPKPTPGPRKKEDEAVLIAQRNTIVARVSVTAISEDTWFPHPTYSKYEANRNGDVRNKERPSVLLGLKQTSQGYFTLGIDGSQFRKHRFVLECIYGCLLPKALDVDHGDQTPSNNKLENLQLLTRREHNQKTARTNPARSKKAGEKRSKRIVATKYDDSGTIVNQTTFKSITEARLSLNIRWEQINDSIVNNKRDIDGIIWSAIESPIIADLEGELWRTIPEYPTIEVSNKGRVYVKNIRPPYKTIGSPDFNGYLVVGVEKKSICVHTLVCIAFHGYAPTNTHTVDHMNRTRSDNRAENLRWATKSEQSTNTANVRSIESYDKLTYKAIERFATMKEAARKYGIAIPTIQQMVTFRQSNGCLRRTIRSFPNLSFRYADLSLEEKKERENTLLQTAIDVYLKEHNAKSEHLPKRVYAHSNGGYFFKSSLFGESKYKYSSSLEDLIVFKTAWEEQVIAKTRERIDTLLV